MAWIEASAAGGGSTGGGNTIMVTCSKSFAGLPITCTNGLTTKTLNCPSTAPYVIQFTDIVADEWTISGTVEGTTYTSTVEVGDIFTTTLEEGFQWRTWVDLSLNYNSSSFNSLENVFEDEMAVHELMTIHACADYLIKAVTDDIDVIDNFVANDTAMKWIGLRDYVCDGLTAINGVVAKFLASQYWERYLKDHVPTMTGNTAPYGVASGTSVNARNDYWKAFDKNSSTSWISGDSTNSRIIHKFTNPICVKKVSITPIAYGGYSRLKAFKVQGSNDGTTWNDLYEGEITSPTDIVTFEITNNSYYLYYSVLGTTANQTNVGIGLTELQFYGRSLNVSVPVMTGNTAPFGTVSSNSEQSASYAAYMAFKDQFDAIGSSNHGWLAVNTDSSGSYLDYEFDTPIVLKKVYIHKGVYQSYAINVTIKGYDGSAWTDLITNIDLNASNEAHWGDIADTTPYEKLKVFINSGDLYHGYGLKVQYYGVDYSEREFEPNTNKKWLYDHGLELEPISKAITDGGTITFGDDFVTIDRTAQANLSIATDSAIDLTNYNKLFVIVDTTKNSSVALIGCASARNSNVSSMTANKVITSVGAYVKDCLDISTVDTSQYPILNANNTGTFNVKELWLE